MSRTLSSRLRPSSSWRYSRPYPEEPRTFGAITAICLLAAPEGCANLEAGLVGVGVPVTIVTAAMDEKLNDRGYIVPGLGDAGDRLYGVVG